MQRVVRSTLVGLLTIAGLTACGDKVTVPPQIITTTPSSAVVRSVTVTPATANMAVGDKLTFTASVNADAGVTDRTVTWSSSDASIASVDANGLVTALKAGTASIIAKSKADATVQGAGVVTVGATNGGAPATVTISTINNTVCGIGGCNSVPANLGNVAGQLDVTLNVDAGGQKLSNVQLLMNCTPGFPASGDTVVAQQSLASASIAAEAASAPVTLSFNTASFNGTTGATAFKNGQCVLKARATTTAGTTVASSNTSLTLNNADVVIGSISTTKSAINPITNLAWNGGDVTVTVTPVMFSGRVPATTVVTFEGRSQTVTGTGTKTALFIDANDLPGNAASAASNDIDNITDPAATATFSLVDAAGQSFTTNPCGAATLCTSNSVLAGAAAAVPTIRLDTQKPLPGTLNLASNANQNTSVNGFLNPSFRFVADSASGFQGPNNNSPVAANQTCVGNAAGVNPVTCNFDNGGVDNVSVVFQFATSRTGTFTTVTSPSTIPESVTGASFILRQITTDALGNADTAYVTANGTVPPEFSAVTSNGAIPATSFFGVDKTPPAAAQTAGPANQSSSTAIGGTGSYTVAITDNLSGPAPTQLVAQVIQNTNVNASNGGLAANNTVFTNTGAAGTSAAASAAANNTGCVIGRWNRTSGAANAAPNALPVFDASGAQIGTCSPTPYTLTGGTTVSANLAGASGYVTTRIVAIDEAGNTTNVLTSTVVEDATNPTATVIDFPTSATGGSNVTLPTSAKDNLDVVGGAAQVRYPGAGMTLQYPTVSGPGVAFDNVLTTSATVNPVITNFARNLQNTLPQRPSTPTAAANAPDAALVGAFDEVNRSGATPFVTFTNTMAFSQPTSNPFSSDFSGGFRIGQDNATVSDCPTAGCANSAAPANPTSTTITASAQGTTGLFANPFAVVQFWYQVNNAGPWFLIGSTSAGTSRDTGVGGSRFWDYSLTWTPPKSAPIDASTGTTAVLTGGATVNVRAIGLTANGDGVATGSTVITLTNP